MKTLQSVHVGLTRSIWGLEEADIIPAQKVKARVMTAKKNVGSMAVRVEPKNAPTSSEAQRVEGGMGKLDIGWLNSRSGRVERDMEAELWEKARHFLEEGQSGNQERNTGNGSDDEDEHMSS